MIRGKIGFTIVRSNITHARFIAITLCAFESRQALAHRSLRSRSLSSNKLNSVSNQQHLIIGMKDRAHGVTLTGPLIISVQSFFLLINTQQQVACNLSLWFRMITSLLSALIISPDGSVDSFPSHTNTNTPTIKRTIITQQLRGYTNVQR